MPAGKTAECAGSTPARKPAECVGSTPATKHLSSNLSHRTNNMLKAVPTSTQRAKRDRRSLHGLAIANAKTYCIKRASADTTSSSHLFTGEAVTKNIDSKNLVYVCNITLKDRDSDKVLLQRFNPANLRQEDDMRHSAKRGKELFEQVTQKARCKKYKVQSRQSTTGPTFPHYHFGAWHDRFMNNLVLTEETRQAGNEEGKQLVTDFCAWFKQFAKSFIQPFVDKDDSGLCDAFRSELVERSQEHFPWAAKQVKGLDTFCHSLYSTFSPFQGFSGNPHIDNDDADVSILVNLGQHAILELPEYNCQVVLQPLDVVFFLSNSVYHRTYQHQAHQDARSNVADRMAITCFFRKALLHHREPKNKNILYLAEQSEQQEQEYQQQRKRQRG